MLAKLEFIQLPGEEQAVPGMKQNNLIHRPIPLLLTRRRNKRPTSWELVRKFILKELSGAKLLQTAVEHTCVGLLKSI